MAEAEPPVRPIELGGADAEVEQATRDLPHAEGAHDLGETVEATVAEGDPVAMGSEPGTGGLQRLLITVETDHGEPLVGREQCGGMTAAADGGIDDHPVGHVGQHGRDLCEHHRLVGEGPGGIGRRHDA